MSNTEGCGLSNTTLHIHEVFHFTSYYIVMPVYFVLGLSGNIILLIAFRKQSKSDAAYAYQIFLTSSKILEIFFTTAFWWGYKWNAGVESPGKDWYMNCYVLMFYSAHIGCPLANGFIVTSLLCSVAMTADRVFALAKPFVYKCIDHKRHQAVAVACCFLIGLSTSAFEVGRWRLVGHGNDSNISVSYRVLYDEEYVKTPLAMALGHTRTAVRLIGVGALIALNILMAIAFRKRARKIGQMVVSSARKDRERRATDKTLLTLTAFQSLLMILGHIPHSGYFIAAFISASFSRCYGLVVAPIADMCIQISGAADLFVIISVNRKIRRAVINVFPFERCKSASKQPPGRIAADQYSIAENSISRSPSPRPMNRIA